MTPGQQKVARDTAQVIQAYLRTAVTLLDENLTPIIANRAHHLTEAALRDLHTLTYNLVHASYNENY